MTRNTNEFADIANVTTHIERLQCVQCRTWRHSVCLQVLLALVLAVVSGAQPTPSTLWEVEAEGGFTAPEFVRDPMSGEILGVVACGCSTGVVLYEPGGTVVWEIPMKPPITASLAVSDLDADGKEEIVAVNQVGRLICVDSDGRMEWETKLPDGITGWGGPTVADLDGDGKAEVIAGDRLGNVSCFGSDGQSRWRFQGEIGELGTPLVADVYERPGLETIITSHEGDIYALDSRGNWLWDIHIPNDLFPSSTPILADIEGKGRADLFIGGGLNHIFRIDLGSLKIVDTVETGQHINSAICAADLNGDGRETVIAGNKSGTLFAYGCTPGSAQGELLWQTEFPSRPFNTSPLLLNCDESPGAEILVFPFNGNFVAALDPKGGVLWKTEFASMNQYPPCAGDINGDGTLDFVVPHTPAYGGKGYLRCMSMGFSCPEEEIQWGRFAGTPANTCRVASQRPHIPLPVPTVGSKPDGQRAIPTLEGSTDLFTGPNTWRRTITAPGYGASAESRVVLLTEITGPDGFQFTSAKHTGRESDVVRLTFDADREGTYEIEERLLDAGSRAVLAARKESVSFSPVQSDLKRIASSLSATEKEISAWSDANPTGESAFRQRLHELRSLSAGLQGLDDGVDARNQRLLEARTTADRFLRLARAATADAARNTFLAWKCGPWTYFDPRASLPTGDDSLEGIAVSVCVDEYEPAVVNLTNVCGKTLEVRVVPASLKGPEVLDAGKHLELRRAVPVPTAWREEIADALPLLDQARLLTIPAWESVQLWLTFNAVAVKPGDYEGKLQLTTLEVDPSTVDIPIQFKVHDIALPKPRPLRFCTWSYVSHHFEGMEEEVRNDLIAHANTIFFGKAPKATFDASGKLEGAIDYTEHDEFLRAHAPHGFILFMSPQHAARGPEFLSDAWRRAYTVLLKDWVRHLADLDVGYDGFALYPYDEPNILGSDIVDNLIAVGEATRAIDPNVLIYTDPTTGSTVELIEALAPVIDIWCPSAELLERHADTLIPIFKRTGKEVWLYDAAGHSHTLSTLGIFRWRPWEAWRLGFTGCGHWVYSSHSGDLWKGPNSTGDYYATVYDGAGVVTSKRWEACREGAEDYEYLYLLRERIRKAKSSGSRSPAVAAAEALLERAPEITALLWDVGRRIPLREDGVLLYENATDTLNDYRRRIIDACLTLE